MVAKGEIDFKRVAMILLESDEDLQLLRDSIVDGKDPDKAVWDEFMQGSAVLFVVKTPDGKNTIGFAAMNEAIASYASVNITIYILPEYRCKNYARVIFAQLLSVISVEYPCKQVNAKVSYTNWRARYLLEDFNFRPIRSFTMLGRDGTQFTKGWWYHLSYPCDSGYLRIGQGFSER